MKRKIVLWYVVVYFLPQFILWRAGVVDADDAPKNLKQIAADLSIKTKTEMKLDDSGVYDLVSSSHGIIVNKADYWADRLNVKLLKQAWKDELQLGLVIIVTDAKAQAGLVRDAKTVARQHKLLFDVWPGEKNTKTALAIPKKVNVNSADEDELQTIPGIGAVRAAAIIAERNIRPFGVIEDLTRVKGISEKNLANMKDHVCLTD